MKKEIYEKFESLAAFTAALDSRPMAEWATEYKASTDRSPKMTKKCTTSSYQEANRLLLNGDKENAKKLVNAKKHHSVNILSVRRQNSVYNAPVGFTPNIPAYLTGTPNSMLNIHQTPKKNSKVITLVINCAASWQTLKEEIISFGTNVVSLIQLLEAKGYRLNLYASSICYFEVSGKNKGLLLVKIKDAGKPLNVTNITYPLVNPSFLRRHVFAWVERQKNVDNYGYVLTEKKECIKMVQAYIERALILTEWNDCNKTIDELLKELEKQAKTAF